MHEPEYPEFMPSQPLSGEHQKLLLELGQMVLGARSQLTQFRSCIALADMAFHNLAVLAQKRRENPLARDDTDFHSRIIEHWPIVAAHSAISNIFHLQETLATISEWIPKSGLAHLLINPTAADDALNLLEKHFPKWKQIRHASAHSAEIGLNPERNWHKAGLRSGQVRKPKGSKMLMMDSFENRTFITTRKGELLRFDVTWENYQYLLEIYDLLRKGVAVAREPQPRDQTSHRS